MYYTYSSLAQAGASLNDSTSHYLLELLRAPGVQAYAPSRRGIPVIARLLVSSWRFLLVVRPETREPNTYGAAQEDEDRGVQRAARKTELGER